MEIAKKKKKSNKRKRKDGEKTIQQKIKLRVKIPKTQRHKDEKREHNKNICRRKVIYLSY